MISAPIIWVLALLINSSIFIPNYPIVYSQNSNNDNNISDSSSNNVYSWVNKPDDLKYNYAF